MDTLFSVIALAATTTPERTPPTEFRIFRAGKNASTKGEFLFDEAAQASILAEYQAHGVDIPIDWEHAMLRDDVPVRDQRAAGWFGLEVRDGELWAVKVRWTDEAAAALRAGEWRFISPAFVANKDTGRISQLINVAICNLPATRQLDALVAAKRLETESQPNTTQGAAASQKETSMALNIIALALALGLSESAAETDVITAASKHKSESDRLVSLTGSKTPEEAFGVLAAWKLSHNKVAEVLAADKQRAEEAEKTEKAALLKQGEESGQITNPLKDWAGKQSVESLKGFLSAAPSAVAKNRANPDRASSGSGKAWTELSTMEQHRLLNDDPETAKTLRAAAKEASLAMAKIKNTDVIDRELLETSIRGAVAAGVNCLYGSGAAVVKTTLSAGRGSAGDQVKVPYFGSIGEMEDVVTDGDALTPKAFASTSELATVIHSGIAFEMTAWAQQGVDDPYGEVARQAVESLRRRADKALLDAALATDAPMTLTTGATFSYDSFVNAKLLWGDEQDDIAAFAVHSKVYGAMLKLKDANLLPLLIDSAKDGGMPRILGVPVIVSDKLVPTSTVYPSLILKKNALVFWMNGDVSLKTDSDILTDSDIGAIHVYHATHKYKRLPGLTKGGVVILKTTEA